MTLPVSAAELLTEWLPSNDDPVRPLMTLGTIDPSGYPDARSVLLSEYDNDGFYFHTDSRSRKVGEVTANPRAVLTLVWPGRQLVVQGDVSPASAEELDRAYAHRSRYLQLLAWLNTPELAALEHEERLARWAAFAAEHPEGTLSAPETWAGFVVKPVRLTFWHGDPDTASRRLEFALTPSGEWTESILPG